MHSLQLRQKGSTLPNSESNCFNKNNHTTYTHQELRILHCDQMTLTDGMGRDVMRVGNCSVITFCNIITLHTRNLISAMLQISINNNADFTSFMRQNHKQCFM
jgi:hypothetical protein